MTQKDHLLEAYFQFKTEDPTHDQVAFSDWLDFIYYRHKTWSNNLTALSYELWDKSRKDESLKTQELIGKKCLKIEMLPESFTLNLGELGLIVQAKERIYQGGQVIGFEMKWYITPTATIDKFWEDGIYQIVGVGMVIDKGDHKGYIVLVNDKLNEEYKDWIPF